MGFVCWAGEGLASHPAFQSSRETQIQQTDMSDGQEDHEISKGLQDRSVIFGDPLE